MPKLAWNKELSKIEAKDKNEEKLRTFYTALYHVMIHPNIAMDVDGNYRGLDNQIHQAEGFDYYTVFSLWDTFRATHPLFTIIDKKRTSDFINTFLAMYQQGGRLPVWELCSNETDCMIGYHSVSVMADALAKGITNFDIELAFEAMKKSATWNHLGLPQYMENGFLSIDDEHESVSKTLEYAYDDWCIAQVAQYIGNEEDYQNYMYRSNAWRNLLDPETKLMRPRKNGGWLTPFEPREVNNYFTEGNSWQYSFFVPQDVNGMIKAMGGAQIFEEKLDELFSTSTETTGRTQADITGLIGQYAHGNEPSHHMAYLYNYVSKPEKTKQRVHQILEEFYSSKPDGLIGNEDCGQMSAWYVMSAMGLYSVTPGSSQYTLTEPFLDDFTVHLENGKTFTKKSISEALKKNVFISYFDLVSEAQPEKKHNFNSFISFVRSPIISAPSVSFDDSLHVQISTPEKNEIVYQIIDENGKISEEKSENTFYIFKNCTIKAYAKKR
jgi:predicted alpha-1,2-mannosidase